MSELKRKTFFLIDPTVPDVKMQIEHPPVAPGSKILDQSKYLIRMEGTDVSDGYHTFTQLYQHRYALFATVVKMFDSYITPLGTSIMCIKSKLHHDGTMFPNSFIVMLIMKTMDMKEKQISYHMPLEWWDKFKCIEVERAPEWDGHMSDDVIQRLLEL